MHHKLSFVEKIYFNHLVEENYVFSLILRLLENFNISVVFLGNTPIKLGIWIKLNF